ncbi:MAG: Glutamyl-tRNA(Gln) amidotransferase subunit A [Chlamydiia bacterium]|nr:Glutamyl-tRNA(Gln) amidotransferase subunit A [Chlamydiia bacterium]
MYKLTARQIHQSFIQGEVSAVEIADYFLFRAKAVDSKLNAYLTILDERAREKARLLDEKRKAGKTLGPLAGVPIAIKDNIHIAGERTTAASKFLEKYVAPYDATVIRLLEEADAILIGKTNLDEFAMGSSNENSAYKQVYNPWDIKRTPGGSSGGSAAAVASYGVPISLGSDTGGSIRQPAHCCGLFGYKPTYGRVPRYGLIAFGSSFDQIGPFCRTAEDVAMVMEVLGRHCERDSTSQVLDSEPYRDDLDLSIQGKTIGIPRPFIEELDEGAQKIFFDGIDVYRSLGCKIVDVDLDLMKHSIALYYILATAEASTNLSRYDGIQYSTRDPEAKSIDEVYQQSRARYFGDEVKRRIILGTYVLSAGYQDHYYKKAQKVRTLLIEQFKKGFEMCDAIAMPTSPGSAFELGSIQDPVTMYQQDIFTIAANLAGLPAINIPAGFDGDGMPMGLQLLGPQNADGLVMRFAHQFDKETTHAKQIAPMFDDEFGWEKK